MTDDTTRPLDEQSNSDAAHSPAGANIAPEVDEDSDEEQAQAQTLADDLVRRKADEQSGEDSEHGPGDVPLGTEDVQDTVDHMQQMQSSGIIDNDAYRGERNDDDESYMLGDAAMEDGDRNEFGQERGED